MFRKYFFVISMFCFSIASAYAVTPIKLVIGAGPGGPLDIMARTLQKTLFEEANIKLIIEYKPGAGGEISYINVANNKTEPRLILLYQSLAHHNLKENKNYNWQNDFVMINYLGHARMILLSNKSSGIKVWKDLLLWPKNEPLTIGTTLSGSGPATCGNFLKKHLEKDWVSVEYKSGNPAIIDLLGNHHTIGCHIESGVVEHIKSGKLIALANIGNFRTNLLPNLASTSELGIVDDDINTWIILGSNQLVDIKTIEKIQQTMTNVVRDPKKRQEFADMSRHYLNTNLTSGGTKNATEFVASEIKKLQNQ